VKGEPRTKISLQSTQTCEQQKDIKRVANFLAF